MSNEEKQLDESIEVGTSEYNEDTASVDSVSSEESTHSDVVEEPDSSEENAETTTRNEKPKKKRRVLIPIFILIIALLAAGIAYYFVERRKPEKAVEEYLSYVQQMDFEGMASLLQSDDLTELDEDILRSAEFQDFFTNLNSKMTFKIRKNKFNIQNGSAMVTARISYINATEIYKDAISECLRKIAISALSGTSDASQEDLLSKPIESQLAPILIERAKTAQDQYAEIDITYPVIKTTDGWKIMSLDSDTASIMSADFKNVKQEIENSLVNMEPTSSDEESVVDANSIISISNENFSVKYTMVRISKDLDNKPCLEYYYDYTNNRSEASGPIYDLSLTASQDGVTLEPAIPESLDDAYSNYFDTVQAGQTVSICQVFALNGTSDVTISASSTFAFDEAVSKQIVKVQ
ncbi:MAG: DUF5067 domain-containing protein [Eubacteriales bacterium]|nr:DUF5067 domain-containing protein [Eubacteriales bacterium]